MLEVLVLYKCQILITGDLNIHVERTDCTSAIKLADLVCLLSFDCVQWVQEPTHTAGGTLDLVLTRADQLLHDVTVDPLNIISDHGLVARNIAFGKHSPDSSGKTTLST